MAIIIVRYNCKHFLFGDLYYACLLLIQDRFSEVFIIYNFPRFREFSVVDLFSLHLPEISQIDI